VCESSGSEQNGYNCFSMFGWDDVRYLPKSIFPRSNFPRVFIVPNVPKCAISQAATSQLFQAAL